MFQKDESGNQKTNFRGKEPAVRKPVMKTLATVYGRGNESHNLGRPHHESLILELGSYNVRGKVTTGRKTGMGVRVGEIDCGVGVQMGTRSSDLTHTCATHT